MAWTIEFGDSVKKELSRLGKPEANRIVKFLSQRLAEAENPRQLGIAMKGEKFDNLWRYRVGDYRIIAQIDDEAIRILVVRIGHRREVYR